MDLRTYILIDSMQPQYAALTGMLLRGDVPVEGMAEVFVELAPASEVYEFLDVALKTSDVRPGTLSVEREFGSLEIHAPFQEAVRVAGSAALCSSNNVTDTTCNQLLDQVTTGQCMNTSAGAPAYWDLGVLGDATPTPVIPPTVPIAIASYTASAALFGARLVTMLRW